jgi:hypothetical protein
MPINHSSSIALSHFLLQGLCQKLIRSGNPQNPPKFDERRSEISCYLVGFTTTYWRRKGSKSLERANQFVGQSLAFLDAVGRASRAAPLNRPVLVIGERGTGKELIAERLHHLSSRWAGPLVTMNCAALPENLIEAELFGHEAGSFTGAAKTRHGRFEEADGGTLFLDELATLSSPAQDRLLRAVEYGEITRIGASKPIQVDVRIVAATNEHLPKLVQEGRFRADCSIACRSRSSRFRRCGRGGGTFRCLRSILDDAWRSSSTGPIGQAFLRRRLPSLRPIRGQAMCANFAMWSNGPCIARKIPNAKSTPSSSIHFLRHGYSTRTLPERWRWQPTSVTHSLRRPNHL